MDKARQAFQKQAQAQQIFDALGFDPFQDLHRVVLAGSGGAPDQALVLLHGRFDVRKFTDLAEKAAGQEPNFKIVKESGYTLYEIQTPRGQVEQVYAAIIDEGTIAVGPSKSLVIDTLDKKAGKKQSAQKKDLQSLLDKFDATQSLSLVILSSSFQAVPVPELEKISHITGGVTLTDEVKAEIVVSAQNAADAKELGEKMRNALNQGKGLIALAAGNDRRFAPLSDFIGGVTINNKDAAIVVRGRVTKEMIEELMKLRDQR